MKFYKVVLEGKNFLIEMDGKVDLFGYFTTRWVRSDSPEAAELKAVELVKKMSY